jgi:hypothetical protein
VDIFEAEKSLCLLAGLAVSTGDFWQDVFEGTEAISA